MDRPSPEEWLPRKLREADPQELSELVAEHLPHLDAAAAREAIANPHVSAEVLGLLAGTRRLTTSYQVRSALAAHPRTPQARALALVPGLYWRELAALGADSRVRPVVRRAADRRLAARLPGLATGEKIAIARRAGRGVVELLRHDPDPRVLSALLDNPRLTEGLLLPLAGRERASGRALAVLARHPRWGNRYPIRRALAGNPATPTPVALSLLPSLKKRDLAALSSVTGVPEAVRRRAALLSGRNPRAR